MTAEHPFRYGPAELKGYIHVPPAWAITPAWAIKDGDSITLEGVEYIAYGVVPMPPDSVSVQLRRPDESDHRT